MGKLLAVMAVALIAMLSAASTALAHNRDFRCNGTFTGVTIKSDVDVPENGACTLLNSTVKGEVEAEKNAYFQATKTSIRDEVEGWGAQTIFIDTGSSVGGGIETDKTAQVFVFNSTINGLIDIYRTSDTVDICGNTVKDGISVARSGRDILIGDPLAIDCAGNNVRGSVSVSRNNTDIELVVRGNTITKGSMYVLDNAGPADKLVQGNTGARTLRCTGNSASFAGAGNPGWQQFQGQCSA
jgi:hypothetical protein